MFYKKVSINFIKKETPTQVYSCEFCEIFKKNYFTEHLPTCASKTWSWRNNCRKQPPFGN